MTTLNIITSFFLGVTGDLLALELARESVIVTAVEVVVTAVEAVVTAVEIFIGWEPTYALQNVEQL